MNIPDADRMGAWRDEVAGVLDWHLTQQTYESGCVLACGYDGDDMATHLAQALLPLLARIDREARAEALREVSAPGWHTNRGYEHDGVMQAYAAGRNDFIDFLRDRADSIAPGVITNE